MVKFVQILLLLVATGLHAQRVEISPSLLDPTPIGLLGMAQDKNGFIWMVDNGNGLFKYNGKVEKVYTPQEGNPNAIASGRIENILIARDGIIWLPTFDQGLDRFDPENEIFTHYTHDPNIKTSIRSNGVRDVVEDKEGNLWIGTNMGLDKYDKSRGVFIHSHSKDPDAQNLDKEQIRDLYIDRAGILWIGTGSPFQTEESTGGLYRLDPKTGQVDHFLHTESASSLIDNRVRAIFEDSGGEFWVGTAGDGLHTMDRKAGTFQRHTFDAKMPEKLSRPPLMQRLSFGDDHITFIEEDNQGGIWIGTFQNGINHYNPSTGITNHYGQDESGDFELPIDHYWRSLKTREGLLWFAAFSADRQDQKLLTINTTPHEILLQEEEAIFCFLKTANDSLYLGTESGLKLKKTNGEADYCFRAFSQKLGTNVPVVDIVSDLDGRLWVSTIGAGLFCYDPDNEHIDIFIHSGVDSNSLLSDNLGSLEWMPNGELLIATDQGISIYDPLDKSFRSNPLPVPIEENVESVFPEAILQDSVIWFGGSLGIFRFTVEADSFKKYGLGLGQELISSIHKDHAGEIWIGTVNHGLRRYDTGSDSFTSVTFSTGHLSQYLFVHALAEDNLHNLWIATRTGVIKLDADRKNEHYFGLNWGFEQEHHTSIYCDSSEDELFLGCFSGYYQFKPSDFQNKTSIKPKPFAASLRIGADKRKYELTSNQSTNINKHVHLKHSENDISVEIGYIDFLNPSPKIQYQLLNHDTEPRLAESGDVVSYYKVPPGRYTFLMKALDIYGIWSEEKIDIHIKTPWYKSWWAYMMYGLCFVVLIFFVDRMQRRRLLMRERDRHVDRELTHAKEIEKAYTDLKATQSQLIHSEKMASLGELTAGIAHEIQNPLNFVNNFSEVSAELVDEMSEEIEAGNLADVKDITSDLKQNLVKIQHHGERASGIVKSMLEHSRTGDGVREPTDINTLLDEYVRLAYHGLRAKDKSFQADFSLDLDPSLRKIKVVPQDIGRVFLNLINNAFYAVNKIAKTGVEGYKPTVLVTTKLSHSGGDEGDNLEIKISDNGPGIPDEIKDKIFQPFFTTKPTGSGTGLGLSLSYDIVKAHGGTIEVASSDGSGTEFILQIPLKL